MNCKKYNFLSVSTRNGENNDEIEYVQRSLTVKRNESTISNSETLITLDATPEDARMYRFPAISLETLRLDQYSTSILSYRLSHAFAV